LLITFLISFFFFNLNNYSSIVWVWGHAFQVYFANYADKDKIVNLPTLHDLPISLTQYNFILICLLIFSAFKSNINSLPILIKLNCTHWLKCLFSWASSFSVSTHTYTHTHTHVHHIDLWKSFWYEAYVHSASQIVLKISLNLCPPHRKLKNKITVALIS
jgi:hypothetical protein